MTQICKRRPGGGGAAETSVAGERLQTSTASRGSKRPLVTGERLAELFAILNRTIALRCECSRRRDNGGWEAGR